MRVGLPTPTFRGGAPLALGRRPVSIHSSQAPQPGLGQWMLWRPPSSGPQGTCAGPAAARCSPRSPAG
eukprot:12807836-Alexandrium_andersonii.AAC.1